MKDDPRTKPQMPISGFHAATLGKKPCGPGRKRSASSNAQTGHRQRHVCVLYTEQRARHNAVSGLPSAISMVTVGLSGSDSTNRICMCGSMSRLRL